MDTELLRRLEALDAKLDYVVERQRYVEELVRDMTPVAREALSAMAGRLAEWEDRGWMALGAELLGLAERAADAFRPEDARELSDTVVRVLETVRDAERMDPVGPLGVIGASREEDVQRGLAVALEVLRQLGRAGRGMPDHAQPPSRSEHAVRTPRPPVAARQSARPASPPPAAEVVVWEGLRFTAEGFLLDRDAWSRELAEKMAAGLGLTLTDAHWEVLLWARQDHASTGASPNVRRVASGSGVGTRRMYELFPGTPGKTTAMLAGIPKPVGCL